MSILSLFFSHSLSHNRKQHFWVFQTSSINKHCLNYVMNAGLMICFALYSQVLVSLFVSPFFFFFFFTLSSSYIVTPVGGNTWMCLWASPLKRCHIQKQNTAVCCSETKPFILLRFESFLLVDQNVNAIYCEYSV